MLTAHRTSSHLQVVEPPSIKDKTPATTGRAPCKNLSKGPTRCRTKANGSTNQKAHGNSPTTDVLMIAHHPDCQRREGLGPRATPGALNGRVAACNLGAPATPRPSRQPLGPASRRGPAGNVGPHVRCTGRISISHFLRGELVGRRDGLPTSTFLAAAAIRALAEGWGTRASQWLLCGTLMRWQARRGGLSHDS